MLTDRGVEHGEFDLCISVVLIPWDVAESISSDSTSVDFRLLFRQSATDDRDGTEAEGKQFNDGI